MNDTVKCPYCGTDNKKENHICEKCFAELPAEQKKQSKNSEKKQEKE